MSYVNKEALLTARRQIEAEVKGWPLNSLLDEEGTERQKKLVLLPDNNPKSKFGAVKTQHHLVPTTAREQLAKVMKLGADKYGAYNWRTNSVAASVYYSAAVRHLDAFLNGEDFDPESGQSHLAHAMACCAIAIDAIATGNFIDDRPKLNAKR